MPMRYNLKCIPEECKIQVRKSETWILKKSAWDVWEEVKIIVKEEVGRHLTKSRKKQKTPWLSDKVISLFRKED